jgi:RNA polymerase sigma-70 factor (ECF subfamily)
MDSEEREILKGLRNKRSREAAFGQLMGLYKRPLYARLRSITGNHEDADDALQNTFIKVWKNIDGFQGHSALFTWMYRIATNEALTIINKRSKMTLVDIDDEERSTNYGQGPSGEEIKNKLMEAVDALPDKQREVFEMKYFSEMQYEEMAKLTKTSVGALKASYFHAVRKIEQHLKEN